MTRKHRLRLSRWRLTLAPTVVLWAVAGLISMISFLTACKTAGRR